MKLARLFTYATKYALPRRRFHRLAYGVQGVRSRMQELNAARQRLQRELVELSGHADICRACAGLCCRGAYNHFTLIDYLVRMNSDRPIADYGDDLPRLLPLHRIVPEKIAEGIRGKDEFDDQRGTVPPPQGGCADLTETGCRFPPEDRPIRCVLWTCFALRRDLSDEDFRRSGILIKELGATSDAVMRAFRGSS